MIMTAACGGQNSETNAEESGSAQLSDKMQNSGSEAEAEISQLKEVEDYCITYINEVQGAGLSTEMEYCIKGNDKMGRVNFGGPDTLNFCIGGNTGKMCSSGECYDNPGACNSIQKPFANIDSSNMKYYQKAAGRQIAGLNAKCYTLDISKIAGVTKSDNAPEGYYDVELCYHPQFRQLLYYKGTGALTQAKEFAAPAPPDKFKAG